MLTKKILTVLAAAASLTCLTAANAWAQTAVVGSTTSTTSGSRLPNDALVSRYTLLAGSKTNAQSLIIGLRTGSIVTLAPSTAASTPAVSFTPATRKMGYGNINNALALAKTTLAKQGITNPTPAQLAAALNGGSITLTNGTVVTMTGILTQRSAGMGWGKIAQTAGVKLGTVVSASKTDKDSKKESGVKTEKIEKADKDDKKDILAKTENVKNHSDTSDGGNAKGSSSSNNSNSGGSSHSGGGSKSNSSSNSSSGGNSGGNGGSKK